MVRFEMKKKVIAILGATGSGKSALGEALALRFNGEIVSADSRQVYRGLNLLSGKEVLKVKQHCIDLANPGEKITVVSWREKAVAAIESLLKQNKVPFVVGGSMLYLDALVDNYTFAPEDETGRVRQEVEKLTTGQLQEELKWADPTSSIAQTTNRRHLVRAVERVRLGGGPTKKESPYEWLILGVERPREELYERIDRRVDQRMHVGMLQELEDLLKSGVDPFWLKSLGLESRYLSEYIEGQWELGEAKTKLKYATHHFARRQLMWWRHRSDISWVKTETEAIAKVKEFLADPA